MSLTKEELEEISYTEDEWKAKEEVEIIRHEKEITEEEWEREQDDLYSSEDQVIINEDPDNSDEAYERYREDASDSLEDDLKAVMKKHYNKIGYYYQALDKLKRHATTDINGFTDNNLKNKEEDYVSKSTEDMQ